MYVLWQYINSDITKGKWEHPQLDTLHCTIFWVSSVRSWWPVQRGDTLVYCRVKSIQLLIDFNITWDNVLAIVIVRAAQITPLYTKKIKNILKKNPRSNIKVKINPMCLKDIRYKRSPWWHIVLHGTHI